ncbi:hypothetical protein CYQ11_10295 [Streptomyces cinnamoneus]|nr:hypothetical protein CYQ11_10295 [Streptomyces cinnamoneus]
MRRAKTLKVLTTLKAWKASHRTPRRMLRRLPRRPLRRLPRRSPRRPVRGPVRGRARQRSTGSAALASEVTSLSATGTAPR